MFAGPASPSTSVAPRDRVLTSCAVRVGDRRPANSFHAACFAIIVALLLGAAPLALGGPPFKTDDPEPVELGHFELYVAWIETQTSSARSGNMPELELNLGVLPDTQFHLVAPCSFLDPKGAVSARGYGDTELGVKIRLFHETESFPQIGIFPLVELPTGSSGRGLGAGHTQIYLPIWVQKSWGRWTTYGGYGWWRNPGRDQKNWSFFGYLLQRDLSQHVTVGAELFRDTASSSGDSPASGFTVGAIINLASSHHLLMSAGRTFTGRRANSLYLAYQLTAEAPALASLLRRRRR